MKTIYKYRFNETLELPCGAEFLKVATQSEAGLICLWFLVDVDQPKEHREFRIHGTGHLVDDNERYLDTFFEGPYVWHLFEVLT